MENRWKVMGGALGTLLILAAGAAAQHHLGDPSITSGSLREISQPPGSPIGDVDPGDVANSLLQTELDDDATEFPVLSAPVASGVVGLGDSSNSEPSDLTVESAQVLESGSINPFFIPDDDEEEESSGTGNEAVQDDDTPLSASGPRNNIETSSVGSALQDSLDSFDVAEPTGSLQKDPVDKAEPQSVSPVDVVETSDRTGDEVIVRVSGALDQEGVPEDLPSAQISSVDILEDTSSRDAESLEVIYNNPNLEGIPDADATSSVELLPLIDAPSVPVEVVTVDPAFAESPNADIVSLADVNAVDEGIPTADPAPAPEANSVETEASLTPGLLQIGDNAVLSEPQRQEIISPVAQFSPNDDDAAEVSSLVLPTSPGAEVELAMAEVESADPSVPLISEIDSGEEVVPASLEIVTLTTEANGFGDVILVEEAAPAEAMGSVDLPSLLAQEEEEIMKISAAEGAAPAPETEVVLVMDAETVALVPGLIASDDTSSGQVFDEVASEFDPQVPVSNIEAFFVADDPEAVAIEDEVLGKDVVEVVEQLPQDEVQISALADITPFSPKPLEVPHELEEAVEEILQAEIGATVEDFGVKVVEPDQVPSIDTTGPVASLDTAPVQPPVDEPVAPPIVETSPVKDLEAALVPIVVEEVVEEAAQAAAEEPTVPTDMYGAPPPPPTSYGRPGTPVKPHRPPTSFVHFHEPKPEHFKASSRPRPMYGYPTAAPTPYEAPTTVMSYEATTKAQTTDPSPSYRLPPTTNAHKRTTTSKPQKVKPILAPLAILGRPLSLLLPEEHRKRPINIWQKGHRPDKPRRPSFRLPFFSPSTKSRQRLPVPDSVVRLLNAPQPSWVTKLEP